MPTVRIEYNPFSNNAPEGVEVAVYDFYRSLPAIIAPKMNIAGRDLHDGGVGENEILLDVVAYSRFALNVNDIQITVIAHRFEERVARVDEVTDAIRDEVKALLNTEAFGGDYDGITVGVSIWLVDMGYATI
jgi:hypothetical protein